MELEESPTGWPFRTRRITALEIFGAVLAVLFLITGLVLLCGQILGHVQTMWGWLVFSFWSAIVLILLWIGFVVAWWIRVHKWSWQLFVMPGMGLLFVGIFLSGIVPKLAWDLYQEPRLTAVAQEIIADPRPAFDDREEHVIAGISITWTYKQDGQAGFAYQPARAVLGELIYRPDGAAPNPTFSQGRIKDMGDNWWNVVAPI